MGGSHAALVRDASRRPELMMQARGRHRQKGIANGQDNR